MFAPFFFGGYKGTNPPRPMCLHLLFHVFEVTRNATSLENPTTMQCSIIIYYLLGFYPYQFSIYPHLLGKKKDNRYETQWGPSTFLNIYIETQWSLSLLKLFNIKKQITIRSRIISKFRWQINIFHFFPEEKNREIDLWPFLKNKNYS